MVVGGTLPTVAATLGVGWKGLGGVIWDGDGRVLKKEKRGEKARDIGGGLGEGGNGGICPFDHIDGGNLF